MGSKGGRPKLDRKRVPLLLRMDPELADWYRDRAASQGLSRTILVERCLARIRSVQARVAKWENEGLAPHDLVNTVGHEFVQAMVELGIGTGQMPTALDWEAEQRRAVMAEVREIRRERGAGK